MRRSWTDQEQQHLKDNYQHKTRQEIAKELDRTPQSVNRKVQELGLKKRKKKVVTVGEQYQMLTVDKIVDEDHEIHCTCKCGNKKVTNRRSLVYDRIKSCGCTQHRGRTEEAVTHDLTNHPLYTVWSKMKQRCYNPKYSHYQEGIEVYPEWKDDFKSFYDWAINNGWQKGLMLYRYNTQSDFTPDNCFFATKEHVAQSTRNKAKKTNQKKFGVDWATQSSSVREKIQNTNIKKYGYITPAKNNQVKENIRQTNIDKYGVEHPNQLPEYKEKILNTNRERYGFDWATQTPEVRAKTQSTNQERYEGIAPAQDPHITQKIRATNLEKYGYKYISQSPEIKNKVAETRKAKGLTKTFDGKTAKEWAQQIGIAPSSLRERINKVGYEDAIKSSKRQSYIEILMEQKLQALGVNYETEFIIADKRGDFLLTNHNLVIEVDGIYWHSDAIQPNISYHKDKKEIYSQHNYHSLFFREDEINNKFDIVTSIICNKIGLSRRIYARHCQIKSVDKPSLYQFCEDNHLMGRGQGQGWGLYHQDKLVCILQVRHKEEGTLEISRFCPLLGHSITGGFSKLLSHVQQQLQPAHIVTFIDKRYGDGSYLLELGFHKETEYLSFRWVKSNQTFHRMKFPGNSGYGYGCYKLWDCGQAKFLKTI